MKRATCFTILFLYACLSPGYGEKETFTPPVHQETSGKLRPPLSWVDEDFVFMPLADNSVLLPFPQKYMGRVAKVISVKRAFPVFWEITLKLASSGEKVKRCTLDDNCLRGIFSVKDVNGASSNWLGKTVWYKNVLLDTLNKSTGDHNVTRMKKYRPLKIIAIKASDNNLRPVRFEVKTETGVDGYVDVNWSGTNVPSTWVGDGKFDDLFLTKDPRSVHQWPETIWAAIEEEKVIIGMTPVQAIMSWGEPKRISRTVTETLKSEQWVYGNGTFLYFDNDRLVTIQD